MFSLFHLYGFNRSLPDGNLWQLTDVIFTKVKPTNTNFESDEGCPRAHWGIDR